MRSSKSRRKLETQPQGWTRQEGQLQIEVEGEMDDKRMDGVAKSNCLRCDTAVESTGIPGGREVGFKFVAQARCAREVASRV